MPKETDNDIDQRLPVLRIDGGWTFRRLLDEASLIEPVMAERKRLSIEVTKNAFLKMDVVAYLMAWCLELKRNGFVVEVTGDKSIALYLARMDFNRHLNIEEPEFNRHSEKGRFIPIKLIDRNEDVLAAVHAICELSIHQFDDAARFIPAMEWAVNEIIDNIRIHSNTKVPGVVCAQYYPATNRLDIAICDMGVGIKESLGSSHPIVDCQDAIRSAISRGITRDPEIGMGNGMAGALTITDGNEGEFHVWTGDSLLEVKNGEQHFTTIPNVSGTGILFSLNTQKPVDLSQTWIGDPDWSYIDSTAQKISETGGIDVAKECVSTGTRPPAKALRRWILSILPEMKTKLQLDFSNVKTASSSFLDELLGRLVKELTKDGFEKQIELTGINPTVRKMANVVIAQRLEPTSILKKKEASKHVLNAWIVKKGDGADLHGFELRLGFDSSLCSGLHGGDAIMTVEEIDDTILIVGFGRVFRRRSDLESTTIYFDGFVPVVPSLPVNDLARPIPSVSASVTRLEWGVFESAFKEICNLNWASFPILSGQSSKERAYVRELLKHSIVDDLLGPADGPSEEIIGMSVRDRYLVGKLAPQKVVEAEQDELSGSGTENDHEGLPEVDASTNQSLVPSSLGFTFCVDSRVETLELVAHWGKYHRTDSERINEATDKPYRCWKRIPSGGTFTINLNGRKIGPIVIDNDWPDVVIQGSISKPLDNGDRLVTLFFVNNQEMPPQNQDEAWVFQPELIVRDKEKKAVFRRRPVLDSNGTDPERESLEMIYRKQVEFAVGHGVAVHATTAENDTEHAVEIRTSILPEYELPVTETPGLADEDRPAMKRMIEEGFLDMENLASLDRDTLVSGLKILTEDYSRWISENEHRIGKDAFVYDGAATEAMERCKKILERLVDGTDTLITDDHALEAFRFANRAMARQRIRSIYTLNKRRGEESDLDALNVRQNRSWRPFQLAFMLLSLPALANPEHKDRTDPIEAYADLLWFPTGGGKTEAYLGVAAFTMAIRRLQGDLGGLDGRRGLSVIMRYTLRLLTLQQFQRATTLICALESMRREDPKKWGAVPFTIGLWVGNQVTPGTTEDAHRAIQSVRDGRRHGSNSPAQLTFCPWCGAEIAEGRDIDVRRDIGRTFIYCGDRLGRCDFGRSKSRDLGIPVLVVDDEIYRHPPSMLIATVDKFAMMAWRGQVRTLFGRATQECLRHGLIWPGGDCTGNHPTRGPLPHVRVKDITPIRPPDLIIQDEFHLISGPLGTMVGLYETVVDDLSTWEIGDKRIRPKVIASTATVRKAADQVRSVFLRNVSVFPPHGLDVEDNFFSCQRPIEEKPGRQYLGICSMGNSRPAVLIRVYVSILTAAQALFERFGQAADPYMTVVGYFNSLRELGGMRRLAEDDVQTRAYRVQMSEVSRPGLEQRSVRNVEELTSRVSSKDIPKKLDQLEVKFNAIYENGKYVSKWKKGEARAIDIVLATNMLSVGVDVNRLGIMVVNGQPKNTAEYIQATSRVGRAFPGLVLTVLTWARPRDLSHYETFEHYHATFYKHVEAQSVTPFAPRALDRGLTGTMVSMMRLGNTSLNPNLGAMAFDNVESSELKITRESISNRAWKATNEKVVKKNAEGMISDRADCWAKESGKGGRRLGYERGTGDIAALLKKPGGTAWTKLTVPMSMREVEPGVNLVMDSSPITSDAPAWRMRLTEENDGGEA